MTLCDHQISINRKTTTPTLTLSLTTETTSTTRGRLFTSTPPPISDVGLADATTITPPMILQGKTAEGICLFASSGA